MNTHDKTALVYVHIFADGSKYFGNAVKPNRPFDFKDRRNKKCLALFKKYWSPVVQLRRNLTIEEADNLERRLFDRYIAKGGVKIQKRPSGVELSHARLGTLGKTHSDKTRLKMSLSRKGKSKSAATRAKMSKANRISNRKVISMFDGKVTTAAHAGYFNKKNPNYIGTWVDL